MGEVGREWLKCSYLLFFHCSSPAVEQKSRLYVESYSVGEEEEYKWLLTSMHSQGGEWDDKDNERFFNIYQKGIALCNILAIDSLEIFLKKLPKFFNIIAPKCRTHNV